MVRWRGRWLVGVGATLVVSLASAPESRAAEVAWRGPPECADGRATTEEAERLLGHTIKEVSSVDFEVAVTASDERSWTLHLVTLSRANHERRERLLTGTSCDEVVAAAAVAMAMVVNGSEPEAPTPPLVEPPVAPAPVITRPPAPSASAKPPRGAEPRPISVAFSVVLLGDRGSLPGLSLGGEVDASLRSRAWLLTALGAVWAGSREINGGNGADFQLAVGGLLGCGRWGAGQTKATACVGAEAGQLSGTGFGVRNPRSDGFFWWAPRADAGVTWAVWGPLSVFGRFGVALPRVRREFVVDDAFVYRPSALVVRGALGLELSP